MISLKNLAALWVALLLAGPRVNAAIPLTLGTTYSGTLSLPGETHTYTFTGTPGQRLFFDSQDADGLNITAALYSPTGATLFGLNDDSDSVPLVLTEPGTYSLLIDAGGSLTGSYQFRLLDLAAAPSLTLGSTLSGQLSPQLACNLYQFNGTRGQRISLQAIGSSANNAQWQLVTPANAILTSGQIYQSLGTNTLPLTGSYTLMLMGYNNGFLSSTPTSFQVLLSDVSDPPASASGFGTTHSGTVNANQTNSFTYTAPAGLPVYFDSQEVSGVSLAVDLIAPGGTTVFSVGETADSGPYILPRSGTYTLQVRGSGGASGNFSFRLMDLTTAPALSLNSPTTNTLSAYATDIYQVSSSAGQRLFYDALNNSYANVQVRLVGPDGQNPMYGNLSSDLGPITLAFNGTYYWIIQNGLSSSSPYQFEMFDIASQPALPINTPLTGTLAADAALIYQLAGTNGEQLFFNGESVSAGGASWTLYDPRNAGVPGGGSSLQGDFVTTLPYNGNYVLILASGSSSPISFSNIVTTFAYQTNAISLGTVVTNNLLQPGGQLVYTFSGSAGQKIYFDALSPNYPSISVTLLSPTGLNVFYGNANYDFGPVTLPQSGTYTLFFYGSGDTTGPISFQIIDVGSQPTLTLNADFTGTLPANASAIYQFAGTNGEKLYFNGKGGSAPAATWYLYDPKNTIVGSANPGGDFQLTLPLNGNYTVLFAAGNYVINYSNQVNTIDFTTNALTLGLAVSNNIVQPGNQVFYTFSGTAGQRLYYDSLSSVYQPVYVYLTSPSGLSVFYGSGYNDIGPVTLPETGTYVLQFAATSDTTGPINFQLLDLAAQPALPLNTDLIGTLPAYVAQIYTLAGTPGEHLYFNAEGVSGGGAYWTLYGPNNAAVSGGSTGLGGDFELSLPYAGTYALVLTGGSSPESYTNQVNTFVYTTNSLTLGTQVTSAILKPGNQLFYTFNGTAGQRLYYDSRVTNYVNGYATLYYPSGASFYFGSLSYDKGPFTLSQSGTYILVLDGAADTTGTVSFNLLDLSAATPLTLGTSPSGSLADQTETKLYKFSGTAGQRVNFQSLTTSGTFAYWSLFGLQDQILGSQPPISANIGIIDLPASGTYVLAVEGSGTAATAVNYQFSATDVSDSSSSTTGFGTVNSGTIGASQTNTFSYNAPAGLPIFFDSQDTSGQNLVVDLIAPDSTTVFSIGETSDSGPYILPRSGTYTLNVRGYNGASGNYSFRLLNLNNAATLPLNTPVSNTLTNPYQTDVYQFTSSAGQRMFYNGLTNDVNYPSVFVQLMDPRGQITGVNFDFANNSAPFIVQYAGTSYVFLRNNRSLPSFFSFQLLDGASQPVLPVNASVTNNLPAYMTLMYQYSGQAGQQLYFAGLPSNPSGYWTIYDPNNTSLTGAGLISDFEVTLPYAGTYLLALSSSGANSGPEVFKAGDFSYYTNSYTIGSTVVDSLVKPGERRVYTFTGTLGQQLFYDGLTNDVPSPNAVTATLFNPQGIQEGPVAGARAYSDRGPFTLQQSGTYTLVIDGNGNSVGSYAFRLMDLSAQPALPLNVTVNTNVDLYPTLLYRYAGTAGQTLYFAASSSNPGGYWALYDQDNNPVPNGATSLYSDLEVTLPSTGTYSLLLYSFGNTAGPETFKVNDFAYFTNSYTIGPSVTASINRPGERRYYTFNGTRGQRLVYDALTNDPPSPNIISAVLYNPMGVQEGPINGRFSNDQGPFTLQQTGLYTLLLDGNGAGVGSYAFRLLDVASQPVLPLNVLVTNALGLYPMIVYQYAGTNGEQMYFRGNGNNPSGYWAMYDPNNVVVSGAYAGLYSDFQVTLPMNGNYVLLQSSYGSSSGPEIFAVNPFNFGENLLVNQAPVLSPIPVQNTGENANLSFTAVATDPNNNVLTFSLDPGGPTGATINASTGVFSWTPPPQGFSYKTNVTVRVTDNGIPNLSVAQTVTINIVAGPVMLTVKKASGSATVSWRTAPGKHYQLQYKNTLTDPTWTSVGTVLAATDYTSSEVDSTVANNQMRFYRVQLLDPTF